MLVQEINIAKLHQASFSFKKTFCVFETNLSKKNGQKVGDFNITFSKAKHIFEMTMLFPMFLCPIRFIKLASKLKFKHKTCLILGHQYFVSVMDTACVSDGQMHIFSSDRSSYSDSVLLYIQQQQQRPLFEILSISANIHSSMMFYDVL